VSAPRIRMPASPILWPVIALAALLLYNFLFTPNFFHVRVVDGHLYGSLVDIVKNAAPVMIIATGMTLVIATGGIDISVGAVVAIAGAVAGVLIKFHDAPLPVVLGVALLAALACGAFNATLVTAADIQPIIATLILMVAGRGIAQRIVGGSVLWFKKPSFQHLGSGHLLGLPVPIFLAAGLLVLVSLVLRMTPLRLFIQSIGGNARASRYSGISVKAVKAVVYAFSGLCAGVAGLVMAANISGANAAVIGLNIELDAILAVVIGGTSMNGGRFYLLGSMLGAIIIQALTTTIQTNGFPVQYTLVVKATAVVLVILLQSSEFRKRILQLVPGRAAP
jgi:galactofuranose transport system permease protein